MGASSLHPPIHGPRIQVLDQIKKQNSKIVILKEVNILRYLDYQPPMPQHNSTTPTLGGGDLGVTYYVLL